MADKKQFDDYAPTGGDPSDLDPFAELTRIMGFDPRAQIEPKAQPAQSEANFLESLTQADDQAAVPIAEAANSQMARNIQTAKQPETAEDFGIDLERELIGDALADGEALGIAAATTPAPSETHSDLDIEAAFAGDIGELEAAFAERPLGAAGMTVDVEALNAAFAEVEIEADAPTPHDLDEAVAAQLADHDTAVAAARGEAEMGEFDLGDIEADINREMEQARNASAAPQTDAEAVAANTDLDDAFDGAFADLDLDEHASQPLEATTPASTEDALANVDMDFDIDLDWSELDAARSGGTSEPASASNNGSAPAVSDAYADDLIAALEAAARTLTPSPGVFGDKPAASNEYPSSALANMSERYNSRETPDTWRTSPIAQQTRAAPPPVETTEMFDQAFSMVDDLELPEVGYDEPVRASSDIDIEFDNLLNEMSRGDVAPPKPASAAAVAGFKPVEPIAPQVARDDYGFESIFAQAEIEPRQDQVPAFEFEFEDDDLGDEGELPPPPYRGQTRGNGGRGMMMLAIVGGIAVLGGLGALAMSWGDSSGGAPALVKADASPTKVRPENPGGDSVPNQNSAVYDTVSRSAGVNQPSQERLVSATEEPIELPQPNDEEIDPIAAITKGEDRVEPGQVDGAAAEDPIAVAPRKVRTVIVKPDGSLAPAPEEPVAEAAAAPAPAVPVDEVAAAAEEAPEQITTGATTATPAEPVAKAAVAGGWSVQIASQPSEDGANKSMKTMGQRYSGAIGERGMHIVKADVPGKGTYWRVRVAAASRDDAVGVCSEMKSAGGSCFVTR